MRECIILAGGMGTRLQSVVADLPKCMAPINGKPFLYYIFEWLEKNNFERVILSLGYKPESIIDFTKNNKWPFKIIAEIEREPLGTGGAIALAIKHSKSENVFIINGDTFFDINIDQFSKFHFRTAADLTIAAKPLKDYDRYGSILCGHDGHITGFAEKQRTSAGIINGGIYLLNKKSGILNDKIGRFSFETDILEKQYQKKRFFAYADSGYFIDIGVPDDYYRAGKDFQNFFL